MAENELATVNSSNELSTEIRDFISSLKSDEQKKQALELVIKNIPAEGERFNQAIEELRKASENIVSRQIALGEKLKTLETFSGVKNKEKKKTKTQILAELNISPNQASQYERMATYKDDVETVKQELQEKKDNRDYKNYTDIIISKKKVLDYIKQVHPTKKSTTQNKRKLNKDLQSIEKLNYNDFLKDIGDITNRVKGTDGIKDRLATIKKVQDDLARLTTLLERAKDIDNLFSDGKEKQIKGIQKAVVEELEKQTGKKEETKKKDIKSIAETVEEA